MTISPEQAAAMLQATEGPSEQPTPAGITPQQAGQMLQSAGVPAAGAPTAKLPQYDEWSAFGHGLVRGAKDLGQGLEEARLAIGEKLPYVKTLLDATPLAPASWALFQNQPKGTTKAYRDKVNKEILDYEKRTEGHPFISAGGRLLGNIIGGGPLGGAEDLAAIAGRPLASKALGGALSGGLYGGLSYDPTGSGRMVRATLGTLLGGVLGGTVHGAKSIFKWLKNKPTLTDDPAALHEAATRVQQAQDIGIPQIPAGAATGDPAIQAREQALLKSNTPAGVMLRDAHQQVSQQIHSVGNNMVNKMGGKVMTSRIMGGELQDAAQATQKNARSAVSKMYEAAEKAPGANQELDRSGVLNAVNDIMDNIPDAKLSPAIKRQLDEMNQSGTRIFVTPTGGAQDYTEPFTVKKGNDLVKAINKSYRATSDPSHRFALGKLKSSVFDSIDQLAQDSSNPSSHLFNLARHIRKSLADVYDQKDIVGTIEKMKGATTHMINPEDVMDRIFGRRNKITDLEKVEKALKYELPFDAFTKEVRKTNPGADISEIQHEYTNKILPQQQRNKDLWDDLRTTKFNDLIEKSTQTINKVPELSYKLLVKNVKNLGKESLDKILGNKEASDKFYKLINVMDNLYNQAPTKNLADKTIKTIHNLSGGIFGSIGGEESRLGGFMHKPLGILVDVLKNINNENWVKANLHLGSLGSNQLDKAIKDDPQLVSNFEQIIKANPQLVESIKRAVILGPTAAAEQTEQ